MPCQSATSCTFWINKPGKDPSFIANRRGINAVEPIAKAYLTTLGDEISKIVADTWHPTEFGGLPERGTTHAIVIAAELTHRLRRNKIHHALFLGDEERAFDNQDRNRIASALIKHAGDTPTVKRLLQRLNYTVYQSTAGETPACAVIREGSIQGDPNGPLLYALANHDYASELIEAHANISMIGSRSTIFPQDSRRHPVTLQTLFYLDDELDIIPFYQASEVKEHLQRTFDIQDDWKKKLNYNKCSVLFKISGRGSKKVRSTIGSTFKVGNRKPIPVAKCVKYLGGYASFGRQNDTRSTVSNFASNFGIS